MTRESKDLNVDENGPKSRLFKVCIEARSFPEGNLYQEVDADNVHLDDGLLVFWRKSEDPNDHKRLAVFKKWDFYFEVFLS